MKEHQRSRTHDHHQHDAEREAASDDLADAEHLSDAEFDAYAKTLSNEHCNVIAADRVGQTAEVEIVVNRGSNDGVKHGDQGIVEGVGTTFTVSGVRKRNCTAIVKLTDEQMRTHKSVVLNPS